VATERGGTAGGQGSHYLGLRSGKWGQLALPL
jgi:hypothetical protein